MKTYVDPELITARRVQRLLDFCRDCDDFPDAMDVALELTRRHGYERRAIGLADLLLEAGLAGDHEEAQRVAVCPPGVQLAAALSALKWTKMRSGKRRAWYPPRGVTGRGWGVTGPRHQPVTHSPLTRFWGGVAGRAIGPT